MQITYVENENLFDAPSDHALAHAVGADFVMGAGVSLLFRRRYGGKQTLLSQGKLPGECAYLYSERDDRHVFYLVIKTDTWQRPYMQHVYSSLQQMTLLCLEKDISHVSMPVIGCGLDGLPWEPIAHSLSNVCGKAGLRVTVYYNT